MISTNFHCLLPHFVTTLVTMASIISFMLSASQIDIWCMVIRACRRVTTLARPWNCSTEMSSILFVIRWRQFKFNYSKSVFFKVSFARTWQRWKTWETCWCSIWMPKIFQMEPILSQSLMQHHPEQLRIVNNLYQMRFCTLVTSALHSGNSRWVPSGPTFFLKNSLTKVMSKNLSIWKYLCFVTDRQLKLQVAKPALFSLS